MMNSFNPTLKKQRQVYQKNKNNLKILGYTISLRSAWDVRDPAVLIDTDSIYVINK